MKVPMKTYRLKIALVAVCLALTSVGVLAYGLGSPRATLLGPALVRGAVPDEVMLTFDDGPSVPYTAQGHDCRGIIAVTVARVHAHGGSSASTRGTEVTPGIAGAVPSGTTLVVEYGHLEWFPIGSGTFSAAVGLDACVLDNRSITTGTVATNDVRMGRIAELETIAGVAGAWVHTMQTAPQGVS